MVRNAAWRRSLLCVLALSLGFASPPCNARIYTNHWAVRIGGGPDVAERIAEKYGYRNMGQVGHPLLHPKLPLICVPVVLFFCQLFKVGHATVRIIPLAADKRDGVKRQRSEVQPRSHEPSLRFSNSVQDKERS